MKLTDIKYCRIEIYNITIFNGFALTFASLVLWITGLGVFNIRI